MDSLEGKFEEEYTLEAIDSMTLDNRDYILQGLRMLEVFSGKSSWYAGFYFENEVPGEDSGRSLQVRKFLAKIYDLEEKMPLEVEYEGLVRNLPGGASVLKLSPEYYLLFEHGELDNGSRVRKLKLIKKEELVGTTESLMEQMDRDIRGYKNKIQLYEDAKIKLSKL